MSEGRAGQSAISVLLVDDHSLVRRGFRRLLEDDPGITVVGEAEDGCLELGVPPGLSAVHRDLDPADQSAARPRQAFDLVESRTRQPLGA